jgi:hypothetical protein
MKVEEALLVEIKLADEGFGSPEEQKSLSALATRLMSAIAEIGEFDGDEFGRGQCTMYLYGESADRLFEAAYPVLKDYPAEPGSRVIRRYGPKGSNECITVLPLPLECPSTDVSSR